MAQVSLYPCWNYPSTDIDFSQVDKNKAAFNRMEEAVNVRLEEINERMGHHREDINDWLDQKRVLHSELVGGSTMLFVNVIGSDLFIG